MSTQIYNANLAQARADDATSNDIPEWLLLPGFLMSVSGIILLALGNWTLLNTMTRTLLLLCGAILCFLGIILIPSWLLYRSKAIADREVMKEEETT